MVTDFILFIYNYYWYCNARSVCTTHCFNVEEWFSVLNFVLYSIDKIVSLPPYGSEHTVTVYSTLYNKNINNTQSIILNDVFSQQSLLHNWHTYFWDIFQLFFTVAVHTRESSSSSIIIFFEVYNVFCSQCYAYTNVFVADVFYVCLNVGLLKNIGENLSIFVIKKNLEKRIQKNNLLKKMVWKKLPLKLWTWTD